MEPDSAISGLVARLQELWSTAVVYPYHPLLVEAKENDCHRNVDLLVASDLNFKVVRGWLVFDFRNLFLLGMDPIIRFNAHSLVEDKDGQRFDITPSQASQRYPFIEHPFEHEDFEQLIDVRKITIIEVEC